MDFEKEPEFEKILKDVAESSGQLVAISSEPDLKNINEFKVPEQLPILPLRNMVLFPGVIIPISVGREKSLKLVREAYSGDKIIGMVAQRDSRVENPEPTDLYSIGCVAQILKVLELGDGTTTIIVQGKRKIKIEEFTQSEPYFNARISIIDEIMPTDEQASEFEAIASSVKDLSSKSMKMSGRLPREVLLTMRNIENPFFLISFVCANNELETDEKQQLLEMPAVFDRSTRLLELIARELQKLELKEDIQQRVKSDLDKQQRDFFLNQQMKAIQQELGDNPIEKEIDALKKKAESKKWNDDVATIFNRELTKLSHYNPSSPDYAIQLNYLQTLIDLPWNEFSADQFDLKAAQQILDRDHCGLEKVKERIIEHLAVLKLKGDLKSPIICLYGPPGVGKTSLGKSIAEALGRKYVRMSLGGVHDESEIRGHRRTYIGAMPGRIIQNIRKAKSANPVFILDEIDKVTADYHGDPSSALLEVLDPEQNVAFHDNFLDVDFDLSNVMFIATANDISNISAPLRDRMEMIEVPGYILEEKLDIASQHLIPRQLEANGLKDAPITFSNDAIANIVDKYTRESGVRQLDKNIAEVVRKIAKRVAFDEPMITNVDCAEVTDLLGKPKRNPDMYEDNSVPGVVTGLAWTPMGGDILFIEASTSQGKGALTLTGNLGNVMKESAQLAHEYIKAHADWFGINPDDFEKLNLHIHVPEGAIPKDGPSAGITMTTAMVSAYTKRKVRKALAMTGEITLRGKVLPVGGIREKILAAKRANINTIIMCEQNKQDVEEINSNYVAGLNFIYVNTIDQVIANALEQ